MSRRGWVLFLAMGVIWGIPYMLIKIAVEDISPATLVFARTGLATVLLLPLAAARGLLAPLVPHWRPLLAYTVIEICLPWVLLGYAEQDISSSLTGLLVAAVPLVSAGLVMASGDEVLGGRRLAGLLLGFAGVAALVGFDVDSSNLTAVGAVGLVAVFYAIGPVILARHLAHLSGLGVVAASLAIAAALYAPVAAVQRPRTMPGTDTVLSVAGLGLVCTALAFLVFFRLIAEVGPARATVFTYVNPAVALVLGVLLLNERVTVATGLGFGLILLGSVLATGRERERAEPEPVGVDAYGDLTTDDVAACPVAEP